MSREAERRATTLRSLNKASSGRDDPAFLQRRRPPYVCALCRPEARKVETGRRCFGGTRTRSDSDVRSPHPTAPVGAHARRSRVSSGPLRSRRSGSWPPPMGGLQGPPQSARTFAAPPVRSKAVAGHPRPISGRGGAICGSRRRPAAGASCCGRRRRLGQVKAAAAAHTGTRRCASRPPCRWWSASCTWRPACRRSGLQPGPQAEAFPCSPALPPGSARTCVLSVASRVP